jgi:choline dehydrogenase-like flavoprotein
VILLRSNLADGGGSQFVGHYLMRHCSAVVTGIFPFRTNPDKVFHKQMCLTDFYEDHREQYGTATGVVQDVYAPEPEIVTHFAPTLIKPFAWLFGTRMQNLLCIAEDEPVFANAVSLSDHRDGLGLELPQIEHAYSRADCLRRDYLVARAKKVLRSAGAALAVALYQIDSFSHAVGTVRFGQTPETGALDPNCRYWGIQNLYVLDGSFMPTSAGINPSLTIAANAARVADLIVSGAVH